jgi:hypothetical protein
MLLSNGGLLREPTLRMLHRCRGHFRNAIHLFKKSGLLRKSTLFMFRTRKKWSERVAG